MTGGPLGHDISGVPAPPPRIVVVDDFVDISAVRGQLEPQHTTLLDHWPGTSLSGAEVLITAEVPISGRLLDGAPRVHTVVTASSGTDHLDLEFLRASGIAVRAIDGYATHEVAEHALAGVLAHVRALPHWWRSVAEGTWNSQGTGTMRRLSSTRLGIVGTGRIGRALAVKARSLGMDVEVFSRFSSASGETSHQRLCHMAAHVDLLVVCASPLRGEAPLIDAGVLAGLGPAGALINVARASLVDMEALCEALSTHALAAAYIDVWPEEPPAPDDLRLQLPNLHLTPHVGWFSLESEKELWARVAAEATSALKARAVTS